MSNRKKSLLDNIFKKKRICCALLSAAMLLSTLSGCIFDIDDLYIEDTGAETGPMDHSSTYTLMVYLCGSDLESNWGLATADLREMIEGYNGNESLNIIVQTGGAYFWHNFSVSGSECQRFKVTKNTIELIDDTVGDRGMNDGKTLTDFITYTAQNYPADRYGLILWNHGGGAAAGYGYDEKHGDEMMSLNEFSSALKKANTTFDFIGFDACLMGGFETCLAAAPYTKYLIASQESEPGCGWYYNDFVKKLSAEPSTEITDLGRIIIDTYIEKAYECDPSQYSTLGMFDTEKVVSALLPAVNELSLSCAQSLAEGDFRTLSKNRSELREMASEYDYVDLYSVGETNNSENLKKALAESTVYFSSTENGSGDNGLSIYYPYHDLSDVGETVEFYDNVDYDVDFDDFLDLFANIMAVGQIFLDSDVEDDDYEDYDWFGLLDDVGVAADLFKDYSWAKSMYENYSEKYFEENDNDFEDLKIKESGDNYILELADEDWDNITNITLNCIADYKEYYMDFGADDYWELDENDNLIVGYDQQWVALNGCIVPFYFEERYETDDYFLTSGYVPCIYNGKDAEIVVAWDTENPNGYVAGVRMVYNNQISSKGLIEPQKGDIFSPCYDIYDQDMNYVETISLEGEEFTIDGEIKVSYEDVTEQLGTTYIYYSITDIFNNEKYTEYVEYTVD